MRMIDRAVLIHALIREGAARVKREDESLRQSSPIDVARAAHAAFPEVRAEPVTLADLGLDAGELARMGKSEVEEVLSATCNEFVWETVGDSCGWYVRSQDGEVR